MAEGRYQRRTAAQWAAMIEAQGASGLSQAAFCRAEGVALSTFRLWKRKLGAAIEESVSRSHAVANEPPLFVPLASFDDPDHQDRGTESSDTVASSSGWEIALDLGDGLRLTVRKVA